MNFGTPIVEHVIQYFYFLLVKSDQWRFVMTI